MSKFVAYHWAAAAHDSSRASSGRSTALGAGYDASSATQRHAAADFWDGARRRGRGPAGIQGAVRFNLFQLMQATARVEGHGVPAKGVTGHGYEGHYFWDTEVYVTAVPDLHAPAVARALCCSSLPHARRRP